MTVIYKRPNPLAPVPSVNIPKLIAEQLGSGLASPLTVINNRWNVKSGQDKIVQDIYVILSTPVGRHLFQPDFGSMLPYYLFEGITSVLTQELILTVKNALTVWLPLIVVQGVTVDTSQASSNIISLTTQYSIKGTNSIQTVTIILDQDDGIKLSPSAFQISGNPLFPQ